LYILSFLKSQETESHLLKVLDRGGAAWRGGELFKEFGFNPGQVRNIVMRKVA
jgi:hypothetical protein